MVQHLDIVQWLHNNCNEGCRGGLKVPSDMHPFLACVFEHDREGWTTAAMDGAAANGHLNVVQWLQQNRTEGCTEAAMDGAASNGFLEAVQWLHENRTEGCMFCGCCTASQSEWPQRRRRILLGARMLPGYIRESSPAGVSGGARCKEESRAERQTLRCDRGCDP